MMIMKLASSSEHGVHLVTFGPVENKHRVGEGDLVAMCRSDRCAQPAITDGSTPADVHSTLLRFNSPRVVYIVTRGLLKRIATPVATRSAACDWLPSEWQQRRALDALTLSPQTVRAVSCRHNGVGSTAVCICGLGCVDSLRRRRPRPRPTFAM